MDEAREETRPNDQGLTAGNPTGTITNDGPTCCDEECAVPAGIPDIGRMHKILITPLDYGWNVKIGCQDFAVETSEKLIKNLQAYLDDPQGTERQWMADKKLL